MKVSGLLLVRHAQATISVQQPPSDWPLTTAGSASALHLGRRLQETLSDHVHVVIASNERKAFETALPLHDNAPHIDDRFREVSKPWYSVSADHDADVHRYLGGDAVHGWEPQHIAIARFDAAIASLTSSVATVVSHGTIMSLWLGSQLADFDPAAFWNELQFPDAHLLSFDPAATIRRI